MNSLTCWPWYYHQPINNTLHIPVNETKRKLENLRSYFRRETKKLQDHERKTSEKIVSRWPYYECLQFIQEFMSVKNETGSEVGFQKVATHREEHFWELSNKELWGVGCKEIEIERERGRERYLQRSLKFYFYFRTSASQQCTNFPQWKEKPTSQQ